MILPLVDEDLNEIAVVQSPSFNAYKQALLDEVRMIIEEDSQPWPGEV